LVLTQSLTVLAERSRWAAEKSAYGGNVNADSAATQNRFTYDVSRRRTSAQIGAPEALVLQEFSATPAEKQEAPEARAFGGLSQICDATRRSR
jgi:hypothetical protein